LKEKVPLEFRKKLPAFAMPYEGGDHYSFRDSDGQIRHAYPMKKYGQGSESVTCRLNADQYERFLIEGTLNKERVIHFSPEARKLFAKHSDAHKVSFTAQFVKAVYQSSTIDGTESKTYEVEVWNGTNNYRTFHGIDRMKVLADAIAWMDKFENSSLTLRTKKKTNRTNTLIEKNSYEGRKNLSHVEIELTLQFITTDDGWVILPAGK
jgi:hypothetical protein